MADRPLSNPTSALPGPALIPLGTHEGKPPISLNRPFTLVGSRHNCHLHLLSRQISKAHAAILRTEYGVVVRDLASREHVYVNGSPISEVTLKTGDELQIGNFKFQFRLPSGMNYPQHKPLPEVHINIEGGEMLIPMTQRTLLIGRKPNCDIPLVEASASTCHAVIFEMDGKRWVRDLGSRTGTWVNGTQVKTAELGMGDELRIGETTMRLTPVQAPAKASEVAIEGGNDDSMLAGKANLATAFSKRASAELDDDFEALVGTAPLGPEEPIPPQAADEEQAVVAPPDVAEPAPVDLSMVDLDAEMNSPADTAQLPVEKEDKRKRPATPRLSEVVEDHVDIDDQDHRMLLDSAIMAEKLSSSATHSDLGDAAAEAMELAGEKPAAQSLAVSSAEVNAEEPIDKVAPPTAAAPPAGKELEFSTRTGWRKRKGPPEIVEPQAPVVPAPVAAAPVAVEPVAPPSPAVVTPAPAPVEPIFHAPPVVEIGEMHLTSSTLSRPEPESVFDELDVTSDESSAPRMDFEVQVPREPEAPKKPAEWVKGKKASKPKVEPREIDLSDVKFDEPANELVAPLPASPLADENDDSDAPAPAVPAPLVDLGTRPLDSPPPPAPPKPMKRPAPVAEAPVLALIPVAPELPVMAAPAAAAITEVISPTEPSAEAAMALEPAVRDVPEPATKAAPDESASLTDTSFGRAVEEFVGESLGPIVERASLPVAPPPVAVPPPAEPTSVVAAPAPIAPVEPEPVVAGPAPIAPVEPESVVAAPAPIAPVEPEPVVAGPAPIAPVEPEPVVAAPAPVAPAEPEPVVAAAEPIEPIGEEQPIIESQQESVARPLVDAESFASALSDEQDEEELEPDQEDAVLDELLGIGASSAIKAPAFDSAEQEDADAGDEEYEDEEFVDQTGEDEAAPLFNAPVRLPPPGPRRIVSVSARDMGTDSIVPSAPLRPASSGQPTLDDILAWGSPTNYVGAAALNLQELPAAPDYFGKVGVSFGESELKVGSNVRAPFEIVQPARRPIEEQAAPVFRPHVEAPKPKMIRPLSDKSRRPRPIRGLTQRRPKPQASTPIGMHEPTMEAEPVLDPTIGSYSPVFGSTLPESFGEGAMVFGGLSMSPVRELDVFSQISRSTIPIDPFTGATPEDIMQEAARPQTKQPRKRAAQQPPTRRPPQYGNAKHSTAVQPSGMDGAAGALLTGLGMEDLATPATEQVLSGLTSAPETPRETPDAGIRSLRAPIKPKGLPPRVDAAMRGQAPVAEGQTAYPVMKKRRRWLSTPWLILAMLMTTAAASVATYMLTPVRWLVSGEMHYPNLKDLNRTQREQFISAGGYMQNPPQKQILMQARESAAMTVAAHKIPLGFLADPVSFAKKLDAPDVVKWPEESGDAVQIAYWSTEPDNDKERIKALLMEVYSADATQGNNGNDNARTIEALTREIEDDKAEIKSYDLQIDDADTVAKEAVSADQLAQFEKDRDDAQKAHAAAYAALAKAEQDLDRARQEAGSSMEAAPTASSQPATADEVSGDPQLADAQKNLVEYSRRFDAAKKYTADEAERNRKALEASIEQFKANMNDVQQLVKDNPGLQQYLLSAQKLQEFVQKLSGDMLDREQRQVDALLDLKRFVDEQIERQRNDRYDSDQQLADLLVQVASVERQVNAAKAQGYDKEAGEKELEAKTLQDKVAARKEELAKDPALTSASQRLQDQIALDQKQLASDREDNDKAMQQLEADLSQNAPAVSNLTKDQKDVADKMQRDVDAMNNARKVYSESLAARDEETNADLKTLQATVQKYAAEVEDRKKELALAGDHKLTDDQQEQKQAALTKAQSDYESAKVAEAAALQTSLDKDEAAARAARQAKSASAATILAAALRSDRGVKSDDLEAKQSKLSLMKSNDQQAVAADPPAEVKAMGSSDGRPFYMMVVGFSVIALFSLVIVGNHMSQAREPHFPVQPGPLAAEPPPDPALAGAAPDPVFGGGNSPSDLHALEAESDEDVDPIVA